MWALDKTKKQQSTALKVRHRERRATDAITKLLDVSENSLKGSKGTTKFLIGHYVFVWSFY